MEFKALKWKKSKIVKETPLYGRLLEYVKPYWLRLALAMVCMLVFGALTAATAYLVKPVLDDIFFKQNMLMLKLLPIGILVLYVIKGLAQFGQGYLMNYVGLSIVRDLRAKLYSHIQVLPLGYAHKYKTGTLMARVMNDVGIVRDMVSNAITGILKDFFTIICLIFVVFYRDWKLAIIASIVFPFAILPIVKFGRRMRKLSTYCQESVADVNSMLQETLSGARIVKAFGMERYESERFFQKVLHWFDYELKAVSVRAMSSPVMELLGGLGITVIIWYGGYQVIVGESTPGTFFSFMAALIMLYEPVKRLSPLNNSIQEGVAAGIRIYEILDTESEIKDRPNALRLKTSDHSVTFNNVSFGYENELVLKNINLTVQSGEVIALVGMSGGGKTTLVNLIPRFYDVTKGAILVDGIDIRDLSIASLRSQIGIVTQDPILFNDTIRHNIVYGNLEASPEDIVAAAKAAYAYNFINAFRDKFDTVVGEQGSRLSGGEKQRICIARALLKDAPILILDEATSSLDTESEQAVQKALDNLMMGRTTFVIAHRLSTIRHADRIVVIVNGEIVEEGKHEQLFASNGEYRKLHDMQFKETAAGISDTSRVSGERL